MSSAVNSDRRFRHRLLRLTAVALFIATAVSPAARLAHAESEGMSPPSNDQEDVMIEVSVEPERPFVHSEMKVVVRLYTAIPIYKGEISPPESDSISFRRIPGDRSSQIDRHAVTYAVVERRFVGAPTQSGEAVISGVRFDGVGAKDGSSEATVSVLADDAFVYVRPIAVEYPRTAAWLPASELTLEDSWSDGMPELVAGKPVERTIRIRAEGVRGHRIPQVSYGASEGVAIHADVRGRFDTIDSGNTTVGTRTEEFVIVPKKAGMVTVPRFFVTWWDVGQDAVRTASLQAVAADVELDEAQLQAARLRQAEDLGQSGAWFENPRVFAAAWVVTMLAWLAHQLLRRRGTRRPKSAEAEMKLGKAAGAVVRACEEGEVSDVAQALIRWGRVRFPERSPENLVELGSCVANDGLSDELRRLDRALYSAEELPWNPARLRREFERFARRLRPPKRRQWSIGILKPRPGLAQMWPSRR